MIDTVVFDFGGVLIDWNPRHLYSKEIADPAELDDFLERVCPRAWHVEHDRGVPFSQSIPARQAEFPEYAELIGYWSSRYEEMVAGEIDGARAVVDELRLLGLKLYGLTNMPAEAWPSLAEAWSISSRIERVLVSGEVRLIKPDPAIFELLVERFELEPAHTVFVDDVVANVEAATACGLHGVHFVDAAGLRRELERLGVPVTTDEGPHGDTE